MAGAHFHLNPNLVTEIRARAEQGTFEGRNGYVITAVDSSHLEEGVYYFSLMALEGNPGSSLLVERMSSRGPYAEAVKDLEIVPYNFSPENDRMDALQSAIGQNEVRSGRDITKFLRVTPEDLFLYTAEFDGEGQSHLVDLSSSMMFATLDQLTPEGRAFIKGGLDKLRELLTPDSEESGSQVQLLESVLRKVGGPDYCGSAESRAYLLNP